MTDGRDDVTLAESDVSDTPAGKDEPPAPEKSNKKKKKKKPKFVDDGRTIYSMEGLTGHKHTDDDVGLTKKERHAAIRAALARYLPPLLGVLACFSIAAILVYLWLR